MRASNAHIGQVLQEYGLYDDSVLLATDTLHRKTTNLDACIDHATFAAPFEMRDAFIDHWKKQGLEALAPLNTVQYPAEHIALIRSDAPYAACDSMIGLSVSPDPRSPINEFLRHYQPLSTKLPGQLQHVAMNVNQSIDMDAFVAELERNGITFMTPILTSTQAKTRSQLRQAFTASKGAYGPFIELIQRKTDVDVPTDHPEQELFNTSQIDQLYKLYDEHSQHLLKKA